MNIEQIAFAYDQTQRSIKRIKLEITETERKANDIEPMLGAWMFDQYIQAHMRELPYDREVELFSFELDCAAFRHVNIPATRDVPSMQRRLLVKYIERLPGILLPMDRSELDALKDYIHVTCKGRCSAVTRIASGCSEECPHVTVYLTRVTRSAPGDTYERA